MSGAGDELFFAPLEVVQLSALLEDCVESLSLLGDITRDILEQREELAQATGDETSQIIAEQKRLERRYEELLAARGSLAALANKSKYKEVEAELASIAGALRESTQLLCRNLKENPNVADNLLKIQAERRSLVALLRSTQGELGELHFRSLLSTVREDKSKEEGLRRTIEREREATAEVKRLAAQLKAVEADKEEMIKDLNVVIARNKTALQKAKKQALANYNFSRKKYSAVKYSRRRQWEERERELVAEIDMLDKKIAIETNVNTKTMDFLARQEAKLQEQISAWNDKYFEDIEAKRKEVESLKIQQSQTLAEIEHLTREYENMQAVVEEDHRLVKQREAAMLFGVRLGEAAARLQKLWRGHRVRKKILVANTRKRRKRRPKKKR